MNHSDESLALAWATSLVSTSAWGYYFWTGESFWTQYLGLSSSAMLALAFAFMFLAVRELGRLWEGRHA